MKISLQQFLDELNFQASEAELMDILKSLDDETVQKIVNDSSTFALAVVRDYLDVAKFVFTRQSQQSQQEKLNVSDDLFRWAFDNGRDDVAKVFFHSAVLNPEGTQACEFFIKVALEKRDEDFVAEALNFHIGEKKESVEVKNEIVEDLDFMSDSDDENYPIDSENEEISYSEEMSSEDVSIDVSSQDAAIKIETNSPNKKEDSYQGYVYAAPAFQKDPYKGRLPADIISFANERGVSPEELDRIARLADIEEKKSRQPSITPTHDDVINGRVTSSFLERARKIQDDKQIGFNK